MSAPIKNSRCVPEVRLGVAEVRELPDRVLGGVLIDDLGALVVLDPDLARETQVRAVEAQQLSGSALDALQTLDHPDLRQVLVTREGHERSS
jgi:hypothetical protein